MKEIFVYGAGGHARVVIDIIEQSNQFKIVGLIDDTNNVTSMFGYQVFSNLNDLFIRNITAGIVAVGDNWQRARLTNEILKKFNTIEFVTAIHPSCRIGRGVTIGIGTIVMAGCNINPNVSIGKHCIINTGSNVDHDCLMDDYASLAPGVTLGGNVTIGKCCAIGIGSSAIPKISIGEHSVIGAGSIIVRDIPSGCIAFGNPCKFIRNRGVSEPYL